MMLIRLLLELNKKTSMNSAPVCNVKPIQRPNASYMLRARYYRPRCQYYQDVDNIGRNNRSQFIPPRIASHSEHSLEHHWSFFVAIRFVAISHSLLHPLTGDPIALVFEKAIAAGRALFHAYDLDPKKCDLSH
jgi:hypothetical protein